MNISFSLFASLSLVIASCTNHPAILQADSPGTQLRQGALSLDLRTDKSHYRAGESVTILVSADRACDVEIWSEEGSGKRTMVRSPDGSNGKWRIPAGRTLRLPPPGSDWKIKASEPFGVNALVAKGKAVIPGGKEPAAKSKGLRIEATGGDRDSAGAVREGETRWLYSVSAD